MQASESFEVLARIIESKPINKNIKNEMLGMVAWLRGQSLCDVCYKKPELERKHWKALCLVARGTGIIEEFRAKGSAAFPALDFVDDAPPPPPKVIAPNPFENMRLYDFFSSDLWYQVHISKASGEEKRAIRAALLYLALESERPKFQRNQTWIKEVWSWLNPAVEKLDIWKRYQSASRLRSDLYFFLHGKRLP